ncbi:2-amino-4-hydroxy-6-hydroxymethyldihydropteridine diphosphokinase [Devosia sp. 63-57]|uniref:2-amino-4-hydroxy-6- hydroxymethyldihydropteridine diphosphokinase n=1 Tax=Devosia sp. 63-57 TaxID=1895751 RepID=UPI00086CE006|nr:2-amino-4-hydroxy-6-hydroxymethyldihydropteridine diphosphokinase [Devosia sp. 63-57]ODT50320.1 MAG: 2-amino-4-hydroxy-6-hydroxymethyldihydropteridine diphosphokinase [Pelagibacterium sp. SCN 63-126]ODU86484.1 MAG: 2-amino-4-hydroxy-6-hydroxymethyldihydropteridine diphosphokinase [Pelagibacterium sp. SCN 63-17]OJX45064.1 MAG: 2-amino-4-hydroxy-6-hydroxymethyldihydropteridine diphosphokinase [Devosia sp. 63-57]
MAKAWLSLGANIGDPSAQLAEAISRLDAHPDITVVAQSQVIRTKAWGKTDQPDFANMAAAVETALEPIDLLHVALDIERDMGRVRHEVWGPRLIDIDIIAYERVEMQTGRLTLPHPFAHQRDFVLVPLREIAPDVAAWIEGRT